MIRLQNFDLNILILVQIFSIVIPTILAADPNCNFYQELREGSTYYVYNTEYPNHYPRNRDCVWKAVAPDGYTAKAECEFEIPNSEGCADERVSVSLTGDVDSANQQVFCGTGNKTLISERNKISIHLQSSYSARGGRFLCSLQAVRQYEPPCDCGQTNTRRIVGGEETGDSEFPMMAGLVDMSVPDVFCGGTIITVNYVLTAAHCFKNRNPSSLAVIIGEHDISTVSYVYAMDKYFIHPQYVDKTAQNDIAAIRLRDTLQFSEKIGAACLPFHYYQDSFEDETVKALGWGTTEFTGPPSDVLLKTDLKVLDYQTCRREVNGSFDQLCTYSRGHDACQKDSGGPILWRDERNYRTYLVGIISNGYGCASSKPGINTRITSYLMWILSVIRDSSVCILAP